MNCGCKCKSEKVREMHSVHKRGEMGNTLPAVKLFSLAENEYAFLDVNIILNCLTFFSL
jgi:hypothetical protein